MANSSLTIYAPHQHEIRTPTVAFTHDQVSIQGVGVCSV